MLASTRVLGSAYVLPWGVLRAPPGARVEGLTLGGSILTHPTGACRAGNESALWSGEGSAGRESMGGARGLLFRLGLLDL